MNPNQQNPTDPTNQPVNDAPIPAPVSPPPAATAPSVEHRERVIEPPVQSAPAPEPAAPALPPQPVTPPAPTAPEAPAAQVAPEAPALQPVQPAATALAPEPTFSPSPAFVGGGDGGFSQNLSGQAQAENFEYISNPFLNSARGLVLILKSNPASALLAGLASVLLYFAGIILTAIFGAVTGSPVVTFLGFFGVGIGFIVSIGAFYLIAGASAREETIGINQAYAGSCKRLLPLIALFILSALAIGIGLLLFIIPGIFLAARLSLAPLILFEENVGPIVALKRSFSLTKGHVNEMLGAITASFFIGGTYSLLFGATSAAPLIGRYHDLLKLKESGQPKPKIHWLNFMYLIGVALIIIFIVITAVAAKSIENGAKSFESSGSSAEFNFDSSTSNPSSSDNFNSFDSTDSATTPSYKSN